MSTNFDEKIRPFCICSPKVGQNQQLSDDKIHTKVAQKVASCQKSNFGRQRLRKLAQFALFRHEFSIYALAYIWKL